MHHWAHLCRAIVAPVAGITDALALDAVSVITTHGAGNGARAELEIACYARPALVTETAVLPAVTVAVTFVAEDDGAGEGIAFLATPGLVAVAVPIQLAQAMSRASSAPVNIAVHTHILALLAYAAACFVAVSMHALELRGLADREIHSR